MKTLFPFFLVRMWPLLRWNLGADLMQPPQNPGWVLTLTSFPEERSPSLGADAQHQGAENDDDRKLHPEERVRQTQPAWSSCVSVLVMLTSPSIPKVNSTQFYISMSTSMSICPPVQVDGLYFRASRSTFSSDSLESQCFPLRESATYKPVVFNWKLQQLVKYAVSDYLVRHTDLFPLKFKTKKNEKTNTTIAIFCEWIKITTNSLSDQQKNILGVPWNFSS